MAYNTKNQNSNLFSYTAINFILIGLLVLISKNYVFEVLNWLLELLNVKYAQYVVLIISYFIIIFFTKTWLIGSFTNMQVDNREDAIYMQSSLIALIGYIALDYFLLSVKYTTFSLLV